MKLKMRQNGLHPRNCRVWLDDSEITNGLTGVNVNFDVDGITRATLRVHVDDLDLDADTLANLEAYVEAKAKAERNGWLARWRQRLFPTASSGSPIPLKEG